MQIASRSSRPGRLLVWLVLLCAFLSLQVHAMHRLAGGVGGSADAWADVCHSTADAGKQTVQVDATATADLPAGTLLQHAALDCSCGCSCAGATLPAVAVQTGLPQLDRSDYPAASITPPERPAPRWLVPDWRAPPRD